MIVCNVTDLSSPLVPAEAGTQSLGSVHRALDTRLRGHERTLLRDKPVTR